MKLWRSRVGGCWFSLSPLAAISCWLKTRKYGKSAEWNQAVRANAALLSVKGSSAQQERGRAAFWENLWWRSVLRAVGLKHCSSSKTNTNAWILLWTWMLLTWRARSSRGLWGQWPCTRFWWEWADWRIKKKNFWAYLPNLPNVLKPIRGWLTDN